MSTIMSHSRLFLILAAALLAAGPAARAQESDPPQVLVFSYTTGYRHESIEAGVAAITALARDAGYAVAASEDPDVFAPGGLDGVDALVLLSTTTDPDDERSEWLRESGRGEALQAFVRGGGGVVGVHAAADSHPHWGWYVAMIGATFARHPDGTPVGVVRIVDGDHPATRGLPADLQRADEWYYFDDFNPEVRVLATLDPQSIGEADVNPNPVSWSHEFEGGRVFYTAMGHTEDSFADEAFLDHLAGGLRWALGED
jgi:type 1 glutamine amidotransferase